MHSSSYFWRSGPSAWRVRSTCWRRRHPINSALSLIVVMAALAGEYLLLGAEFVAAVQVIVYAGAIMVLFVFRHHAAECGRGRARRKAAA
jgi:NADH:ubiquinone oxidoreductase subunit 6 (subunit J)